MKIIYYKSDIGNFGDDLNAWLWKELIPDLMGLNDNIAFLGIGSILTENSPILQESSSFQKKIIFGSGVRSINDFLEFDNSWYIPFVRGKYSSLKLFGDTDHYIADGAYFLALLKGYEQKRLSKKTHKIGFIPYFRSVDKVDWEAVCKKLDWHLILPTKVGVDGFIDEVVSCDRIISEAMHGAMIADIYRVPWERLRFYSHIHENEVVSEFKWNDWLSSIELNNTYVEIPYIIFNKYKQHFFPKRYKKILENTIVNNLRKCDLNNFKLSSDGVFNGIVSKCNIALNNLHKFVK